MSFIGSPNLEVGNFLSLGMTIDVRGRVKTVQHLDSQEIETTFSVKFQVNQI